jgi:hypothetical protein
VLLAAFDNRRPTRDVDFAGQDIGNDEAIVLALVKSVLCVQLSEDDGIESAFISSTSKPTICPEVSLNSFGAKAH